MALKKREFTAESGNVDTYAVNTVDWWWQCKFNVKIRIKIIYSFNPDHM